MGEWCPKLQSSRKTRARSNRGDWELDFAKAAKARDGLGRLGWRPDDGLFGQGALGFCVSVHSIGDEVLCFDTDLEVFISLELWGLRILE